MKPHPSPSAEKRHKLQPNRQQAWHTGIGGDGRQYFLGMDADAAVCLRFAPDGTLEGAETRGFEAAGIPAVDLDPPPAKGAPPVPVPGALARLNPAGCALVADWAAERIAKEGPVYLREFEYPERRIALRQMPALYEEFLESPWAYDEEERFGLAVKISRWRELDRFVIVWHGEHWCASDGLIHS